MDTDLKVSQAPLDYLKPLDGIRAVAILLVLVWHYVALQVNPIFLGRFGDMFIFLTAWTWSGVDLFFVLSGFLIGRILIHHRNSEGFFSTFYIRRISRIFPAYYLVVGMLFLFISLGMDKFFPWLMQAPFPAWVYLTYLQNFYVVSEGYGPSWLGITWSLAIEEQFYLILPLLLYFLAPRHLLKVLIAGIVLAPVFRMILPNLGPYVLLPARMDALLIGVLIAYFHLNGQLMRTFARRQHGLAWAMAALFVVMMGHRYVASMEDTGGVFIHSILAAMYGVLVIWALVLKPGSPTSRFLSCRPMAHLARISYMVYLTHQIFSGLLHGVLRHQIPQIRGIADTFVTLLALTMTIVFSSWSYKYIEKPFLEWGKTYRYRS